MTGVEDKELVLKAEGQYDDADPEIKAHLIAALKAVAAEGQKWETKTYYVHNGATTPSTPRERDGCTQSTFFSVNRYSEESGQRALESFMSVSVALGWEKDEGCESATEAAGLAAGAISGIAGAFFGLLKFAC